MAAFEQRHAWRAPTVASPPAKRKPFHASLKGRAPAGGAHGLRMHGASRDKGSGSGGGGSSGAHFSSGPTQLHTSKITAPRSITMASLQLHSPGRV